MICSIAVEGQKDDLGKFINKKKMVISNYCFLVSKAVFHLFSCQIPHIYILRVILTYFTNWEDGSKKCLIERF